MSLYPLWDKYHLSLDEENIDKMFRFHWPAHVDYKNQNANEKRIDKRRYVDLVEYCHHAVADYWEAHPEDFGKLLYFDVANLVAKRWMDEACAILNKYGIIGKP